MNNENTFFEITLLNQQSNKIVRVNKDETLLSALRRHHYFIPALCNGKGTCGSCQVIIHQGDAPIASKDKEYFTNEALDEGRRLACTFMPQSNCSVEIVNIEKPKMHILAPSATVKEMVANAKESVAIAVDIGTTTIVMALVDLESQQTITTFSAVNPQRAFGADVISRIEAANAGHLTTLTTLLLDTLAQGLSQLTENYRILPQQMTIAANTTIVHLLMGYSCQDLGRYPFTGVHLEAITTSARALFAVVFGSATFASSFTALDLAASAWDFPVTIFPAISAFVGGDITAGLYALDFHNTQEISLLVDLGTNGELALGNREQILVASTAVGPAFEGANITYGCTSVPGAIWNCNIVNRKPYLQTIDQQKAIGICGSGVIAVTSELIKQQIIDSSGLLAEEYFTTGFPLESPIMLAQQDIRAIQMAKAAIRAGINSLLAQYGITEDAVKQVYLAGGFGHALDVNKAIHIGLLPAVWRERVKMVGNTSLLGASKSLSDADYQQAFAEIISSAKEIKLANNEEFNQSYIKEMSF